MFYVLTSHNIYALARQFRTLPKRGTTVIINTLNKDFEKSVQAYCSEEKIRCITTESDGSAATGKNKFLEIFEDDDVPYAVLVDGDDYLTERGVKFYTALASLENPPDALALWKPVVQYHENGRQKGDEHKDPNSFPSLFSPTSIVTDWKKWASGQYLIDNANFELQNGDLEFWKWYNGMLENYMGMDQLSTRITFMSRKVLPYKFKPYTVGEDVLQFLEIKDAHENEELVLQLSDEKNPTYIHDLRLSGISQVENEETGFFTWLRELGQGLQQLKNEGKLHKTRLSVWH